jgi:hypothetical protein
VSSKTLKGVKFQISWNTNVPSSTGVTFTCCGTYVKNELVTNHAYTFSGTRGVLYTYAAIRFTNYTNARGIKGYIDFDFLYPLDFEENN